MSGKSEKDKQKSMQEKYQAVLSELLKQEENKYCVDCDAKGPRWASWNLGVFLCIRCAGIHRNLGVHVSRVKSVNLDSWTAEQMAVVQEVGNGKGRAIYEANLPDNFRRPQTDSALEALIRAKYEHKKYVSRDWNAAQPRSSVVSTVQDVSKKEKEKKRSKSSLSDQLPAHDQRSLGSAKNISDSNLVGSRVSNKTDAQSTVTPDRKIRDTMVQLPARSQPANQKVADSLPHIELISLASPEMDSKSDGVEFGNFLGAPVSTTSAPPTSNTSNVATSSDLAELDFFSGGASQAVGDPSSTTASSSGIPGIASKDDIMALFGPSSNSNMYGVPGGMYLPRQQVAPQPANVGYAVMPNGMPMMQPMMGVTPMVQGVNGSMGQIPVTAPPSYSVLQGYPQMQVGTCQVGPGGGVVWCPQGAAPNQPQQMVAGHTLSNVLWQ